METIKIIKITSKTTKANKPYKMCEVEYKGEIHNVNIWSNAPDFANLKEGSVLIGEMVMEGQYWNISFNNAPKPSTGQNQAFKQKVIEETMQKKADSIGRFQDNKEYSIKVASTMSGAVACAVAEFTHDKTSLDNLEQLIKRYRRFLWNHWEVSLKDTDPITGEMI